MDKQHKISIPEPCNENWDKMTPKDNGRFCLNCSKTVIDFTTMLPDEIQHFFISNPNKSICGRFKNTQLDEIIIQIPSNVVYSQTQYYKMFLLALFVVMGTTLFSCVDKDGKKKKIDKVEIVKDVTPTENVIVGEPAIDESDSKQTVVPPPPPPKNDQVKFINPQTTKTKNKKTSKAACKKEEEVEHEIHYTTGAVMQTNAEYPGGIEQFYNFFAKEFKTPQDIYTKNLKIRISFAVEKDGSMSYMQSEPAIDQALEYEIIRVLKVSPKWQAGQLSGKKIRMQYSLPITF